MIGALSSRMTLGITPSPRTAEAATTRFTLSGLATVAVENAGTKDLALFHSRLALAEASTYEPDLTLTYEERLDLPPTACHLGPRVAFAEDQFYLRQHNNAAEAIAALPLDCLGRGLRMRVRRGASPPLLRELLNLCVLSRGGLALHASAFEFEGRSGLIVGWPGGGKTEALLGMIAAGAQFVADDWTYLRPDGEQVFGLPEPIDIRERCLAQIPDLQSRAGWRNRARLQALRTAAIGVSGASRVAANSPLQRPLTRLALALDLRQKLRIRPSQLFGDVGCLSSTRLDTLFLCLSWAEPGIAVRRISITEAAPRILAALEYERKQLQHYYLQFRAAFPDRWNPLLEQASALEEQRLRRALTGRAIYLVQHPQSPHPHELAAALTPLLRCTQDRRFERG